MIFDLRRRARKARRAVIAALAAAQGLTSGPSFTRNSLTPGDLFANDWGGVGISGGDSEVLVRWTPTTVAGGTGVNVALNAPTTDRTGTWFLSPVGCTSVNITLSAMLYTGDSSGSLVLRVLAADGSTVIATTTCTLAVATQQYTLTANVTAGTEYILQLLAYHGGAQNRAIITSTVICTPVGASGIFASNFDRVAVDTRTVRDSCRNVTTNNWRGPLYSPHSRFVFTAAVASFVVQYWESLTTSVFSYTNDEACAYVIVDGVANTEIPGVGSVVTTHQVVTSDSAKHTFEIVSGGAGEKATTDVWLAYGNQPQCVFVPAGSIAVQVENTTTPCRIVVWDSIGGLSADFPPIGGWPQLMRWGFQSVTKFNGRVVNDTMGSHRLTVECTTSNAVDLTKVSALVAKWAALNPTEILIGEGSNEARDAIGPQLAYATISAIFDAIISQIPTCRVGVVTPILRGDPTSSVVGTRNYEDGEEDEIRHGMFLAAQGRGSTFAYYDGRQLLSFPADYQGDITHPTNAAMPKFANTMNTFMATFPAVPAYNLANLPGVLFYSTPSVWTTGLGHFVSSTDAGNGFFANSATKRGATGPIYLATGWVDGTPCLSFTGAAMGLTLSGGSAMSFSFFSMIVVGKFTDPAGEFWTQDNDSDTYVYGSTGDSFSAHRNALTSSKNIATNWMTDNVAHAFVHSFKGKHNTHHMFIDGVQATETDSAVNDPNSQLDTGAVYFFANQLNLFSVTGLVKEWALLNHILFASAITAMHSYLKAADALPS